MRTTFRYVQYLGISEKKIHELETQLHELRLKNTEMRKRISGDSADLTVTPYDFIKTHIIGRDPMNINGYLYIDKGSVHGIKTDQPALTTDGLVGKVHYVTEHYSIIETIEHEGFAVSALDVRTGIHGIVRKNAFLVFDFIRADDTIYVNDSICSSGMSEIFPEGVFIGSVRAIGQADDPFFKPIHLAPGVKINRLTYLYVLLDYRTNDIKLNIHDTSDKNEMP
ncbi:rod shape-determining protein MreC [candidate division WOR-3 bacterium]|nr:rod shape-determining protein MreC [candidate division WOR-3 bacterium]